MAVQVVQSQLVHISRHVIAPYDAEVNRFFNRWVEVRWLLFFRINCPMELLVNRRIRTRMQTEHTPFLIVE